MLISGLEKPEAHAILMRASTTALGVALVLPHLISLQTPVEFMLPGTVWRLLVGVVVILGVVLNFRLLGIGVASVTTSLLALPLWSLSVFGPLGMVAPAQNETTQLIEQHFKTLLLIFYYVWDTSSWLFIIARRGNLLHDGDLAKNLSSFRFGGPATWFLAGTAIFSALVFLPELPGAAYRDRPAALLPGQFWNVLMALGYLGVWRGARGPMRTIALLFVPLWVLSHFARAEIFGVFIAASALYFHGRVDGGITRKTKLAVGVAMASIVTVWIGLIRNAADRGLIPASDLALDLINPRTVQDLVYAFAASLEYRSRHDTVPAMSNLLYQLLPGAFFKTPPPASQIVSDAIPTNHGILFPVEWMLSSGWAGVLIAPVFLVLLIILPFECARRLPIRMRFFVYVAMMATIHRFIWYGTLFWLNAVFILAPGLALMVELLETGSSKEEGLKNAAIVRGRN